jgi:flagellar hook-associated protein 3 FlgL
MIPAASLGDLAKAQQALIEAARQSSAQTKATDLKGYGREAQTLVSAERLVARQQGFLATSKELTTRMQIQDVALSRASEAIAKLKDDLFQNVGLENGEGVRAQLEEAFSVIRDTMNTNLGGRYLFGGVLNEQPPVKAPDLEFLANNALPLSLEQGAEAQTMRIEDSRTTAAGVVADDFITAALESIKRLAEVDEGVDGPFSGKLTTNQKTAIQNELGALSDAFDAVLSAQSEHGRLQKGVTATAARQTSHMEALNNAIGDIVNVDLAEVAVRLNQAQFAYESSAGVFNVLRNLSLLNTLK